MTLWRYQRYHYGLKSLYRTSPDLSWWSVNWKILDFHCALLWVCFRDLWLFSNHSWVRFSGFSSSIWASRWSRKCGVLRPQFAVSSFAYTVMDLRSSNLPQFSIFWHKSISNYRSVADFWCVVQTPINSPFHGLLGHLGLGQTRQKLGTAIMPPRRGGFSTFTTTVNSIIDIIHFTENKAKRRYDVRKFELYFDLPRWLLISW